MSCVCEIHGSIFKDRPIKNCSCLRSNAQISRAPISSKLCILLVRTCAIERNSGNRSTSDSHRRVQLRFSAARAEGSLAAQANHRCSKEREVGGAKGHSR